MTRNIYENKVPITTNIVKEVVYQKATEENILIHTNQFNV